jgi:hypothetical protein
MAKKPRAGRIDTSTGRNKRDKVVERTQARLETGRGVAPQRQIGTGQIVRGGRLARARARKTRGGK